MLVKALFPRVDPQPFIRDFAIAPDGKTVALATWSDENDHLYVLTNLDTATMKEVVDPSANLAGMAWSADSKTLFFTASGIKDGTGKFHGTFDLWQYHVNNGTITNFTDTENEDEAFPRIAADGKTLFFTGRLDTLTLGSPLALDGINQWLQMSDIFATPVARYAPTFVCSGTAPVISPDGKMLFVYQQRPGKGEEGREIDICYGVIFDMEGRELKSIYFGPEVYYLAEGFSFAPDGNSFAYAKNGSIWIDTVRWDAPHIIER